MLRQPKKIGAKPPPLQPNLLPQRPHRGRVLRGAQQCSGGDQRAPRDGAARGCLFQGLRQALQMRSFGRSAAPRPGPRGAVV